MTGSLQPQPWSQAQELNLKGQAYETRLIAVSPAIFRMVGELGIEPRPDGYEPSALTTVLFAQAIAPTPLMGVGTVGYAHH